MLKPNNYFLLFSSIFLTTSSSFKFNNLNEVQKNLIVCKSLLQLNDDVEVIDAPLFSHLNHTNICFLKCVYEKARLINKYGFVELLYMTPVIENFITRNSQLIQDRIKYIALNLISICESGEKLICLKTIQTMNCLEIAVYLFNYGYIPNNAISNKQPDHSKLKEIFREAIVKFQLFFNLEVTGILGKDILEIISIPRCGVTDIEKEVNRKKRYILADNRKWKKHELAYKILKYPESLPKKEVDDRIAEAFHEWSKQTPLRIERKTSGEVDIEIDFVKSDHGDKIPFDGPGGYLAHTFYPKSYNEDTRQKSFIHFDMSENWTTAASKSGVQLFRVALHEIGHSLGMKHSQKKNAIMWPLHKNYQRNYTLAKDDIRGIQKLYDTKKNFGFFENIKNGFGFFH